MLPNLCQVVCKLQGRKKKKGQISALLCFSSFPPTPSFVVLLFSFIIAAGFGSALPGFSRWQLSTVPYFFLAFCSALCYCVLFGYTPYCVPSDSKKNHNLFPIPASSLSSAVLSESMRLLVLCVTAVHPSCFFPTLVTFNPFSFNFGSHFL